MKLDFKAVEIMESGNCRRIIADVDAAARFLLYKWPGDETAGTHLAARKACMAALDGTGSAAAVRKAFIAAARAADILF